MAITGLILIGFVISHMIGNLKLYLGVIEHDGEAIYDIDLYAEFLRNILVPLFPERVFLWIARIVLLASVGLHIHSFYSLNRLNLASGNKYESKQDWIAANFASRSMRYSGVIVLAYILFHLADLTLGWIPGFDFEHGAVQSNVVGSLSNPIVAIFYAVATILLCAHIYHGTYSMFQSLGINNPKINDRRHKIAGSIAGLVLVGNLSFPIAVQANLVDFEVCSNANASVAEQVEDNCVTGEEGGSEIEGESESDNGIEETSASDSELDTEEISALEGES